MPITQQQIQNAQTIQHSAAHNTTNQIRLIAGPGTGKSFVIEERISWLLNNGVNPNTIFAVSFTRPASMDLRNRIVRYCIKQGLTNVDQVSVTTLHSLALRILRAAGLLSITYPVDPIVMDNWELENILDSEFSHHTKIRATRCAEIREYHEAFWSTGQWGPPNYIPPNPQINQNERRLFNQFKSPRTQAYACVLPGEIVRKCLEYIASGVLDPVEQLQINHLIVDEYQDLNPCDLQFIDHMIDQGVTTFVAGDDDQSIYSFRYASPEGIQDFVNKYPLSGNHALNDCFRCTPTIIDTAENLILTHSLPNRIIKSLNSVYSSSSPPLNGYVFRWRFRSGVAEARAIAQSCRDLITAGISPREIMILLSNKRALENDILEALQNLNIMYQISRPKDYLESPEGRFVLSCLRIICNPNDYIAHRVMLGLSQGVGIATCTGIINKVIQNNLNFRDIFYQNLPAGVFNNRETRAINTLRTTLSQFSGWTSTDTLNQRSVEIEILIEQTYGTAAKQTWIDNTTNLPSDISLREIRDYFWADNYEQETNILNTVYERLNQEPPDEAIVPDQIRIMSMHASKGLSAQVVFIPGLVEEILPGQHRRPYVGLVLEAARLLYMSVTRARLACILSFANTKVLYGKFVMHTPSRFTTSLNGVFAYQNQPGLSSSEVNSISHDIPNL